MRICGPKEMDGENYMMEKLYNLYPSSNIVTGIKGCLMGRTCSMHEVH
jgi:hypothetical protein